MPAAGVCCRFGCFKQKSLRTSRLVRPRKHQQKIDAGADDRRSKAQASSQFTRFCLNRRGALKVKYTQVQAGGEGRGAGKPRKQTVLLAESAHFIENLPGFIVSAVAGEAYRKVSQRLHHERSIPGRTRNFCGLLAEGDGLPRLPGQVEAERPVCESDMSDPALGYRRPV